MNNGYYIFGSTKNPYGLKDGQLLYVEDVTNGLNCGCVCPTCKCALIAKQGDIRTHHFAHQHDDNSCLHIQDTYFNLTKEIIEQNHSIMLPQYNTIDAKRVIIKKVWSKIISHDSKVLPDIIAETEDGMKIHIRYSRKKHYGEPFQNKDIVCLELDATDITFEKLPDFLLNTTENKKWISNPVYDAKIKERRNSEPEYLQREHQFHDSKIATNHYLESGTAQQRDIKKLLRDNEYVGKSIANCHKCSQYGTNCKYQILNFIENNKEYVICSNPEYYKAIYFKNKYLDFKPKSEFDALEQYEAKLRIDKHFTKETTIVDYIRMPGHIVVMHAYENNCFFVTNVRLKDCKFHFSHEKSFDTFHRAEKYFIWLKNLD